MGWGKEGGGEGRDLLGEKRVGKGKKGKDWLGKGKKARKGRAWARKAFMYNIQWSFGS